LTFDGGGVHGLISESAAMFGQRLLPLVMNGRCRPIAVAAAAKFIAPKRSVAYPPRPPKVLPQEAEAPAQAAPHSECETGCTHHRPVRLSWAKLLKRVFEIDMEHCPNCGGELKISAAILE
jgi:hypothetical protein